MRYRHVGLLLLWITLSTIVAAQHHADTSIHQFQKLSTKYIERISVKAEQVSSMLDNRSQRVLRRLERQEKRLYNKVHRNDSLKAAAIFGNREQQYQQLQQQLVSGTNDNVYQASLDTLGTSLQFLQQHPQWLSSSKGSQQQITAALGKIEQLQVQFKKSEEIKKFLKQRKEFLRQQLSGLGFAKDIKRLNKTVFYYSEQLKSYKDLLKDHRRIERKAIEQLCKSKLFKNFLRRNSQLAHLFRLPVDANDPSVQINLAGLQTRAQVNSLIQQQIASGGPNAMQQFQQNIQTAQSQLNELKKSLINGHGKSSDDEVAEGFKPNTQKTKTFLQRLEFGTNIQSQKASGFFPVTSDIGLSIGYKLNDKSIIGIGASYKMGWGNSIRKIRITHQGVGIRSFCDWKIKNSLSISAGYEINYRSQFRSIEVLKNRNAWQRSGLVGFSKTIPLKTKLITKTKLQVLWDFLSYQQIPKTQPILFRVGYNF